MPENVSEQGQDVAGLPEIPAKPSGAGGPGAGSLNRRIGQYYDDNRQQIEAEIAQYGEKVVLKRWNIKLSSWNGIKKRWAGIKRTASGRPKGKSQKTGQKDVPKGQVSDWQLEYVKLKQFHDGYRQAVLDLRTGKC